VRFANQTPAERLEACKLQGEAIHPGYSRMVKNGITRSWHKMKYQQGAWRTDLPEIPEILQNAIGQVYFAGEHMSMLPGWQEGAIISAQKVMEEISNRISL
jgi:monoamine oxidase